MWFGKLKKRWLTVIGAYPIHKSLSDLNDTLTDILTALLVALIRFAIFKNKWDIDKILILLSLVFGRR